MESRFYTRPEMVKCPTCKGKGTERVWAMGKYRATVKCLGCHGAKMVNTIPELTSGARLRIRKRFTSALTPILIEFADVSIEDLWDQLTDVWFILGQDG